MTDQSPSQHPLHLYNSLTRKKEQFVPQDPKRVTMYNCGPTVYSYAHIGNARAAVVADVLFRVLRHIYGEEHVVYARNITDVDDKIIASAKEQDVDISVITEKYAKIYNEDLAAIGCLPPTHQPKATDNIQEMADIIVELLDKDIAYSSEGHILFDVTKMDNYGKLSRRKLDDNLAGARVDVASYKRNSGDFILWKPAKEGEPGWSQQEGSTAYKVDWRNHANKPFANVKGRPGWHIECSAMVRNVLGDTIDIHCGGVDLKFPHHENEIAQSECANEKEFARFWVHNEFLNMGSEKMSKSLGNVKLINDLLKDWPGEVIRLALLKAHYRSELVWSEQQLKEAESNLMVLYGSLQFSKKYKPSFSAPTFLFEKEISVDLNTVEATMDLLHTANSVNSLVYSIEVIIKNFEGFPDKEKLGRLHENAFVSQYFKADIGSRKELLDRRKTLISDQLGKLISGANLLGLLQKDPEEWFAGGLDKGKYDALVADYDTARADAIAAKKAGDKALMGSLFKRSDEIRDELKADGVVIETGPDSSTWRKD